MTENFTFPYLKFLVAVSLILICRPSFAQETAERPYGRLSFTANAGLSRMTSLPGNIDEQMSSGSGIHFQYNILLSNKKMPFYLTTGIGYEKYRYIADGIFRQTNEGYSFVPTPNDYKQHEIVMQSLQVPLLFKFVPFREAATSIGFYGNYLLNSKSKYKIGADKFSMEAAVQNRFQFGLAFDQEFIILRDRQKRTSPVLGFGLNYQLSQFLSDGRSFKPLAGYLKIGISLW